MNTIRPIAVCLLALFGFTMTASASDPIGVSASVISRVMFEPFTVRTEHDAPIDFRARAKSDFDMVVRQHVYLPDGNTGWHKHPGPVFISVKTGTLTFYEYDDPTCTPIIVHAGQGYVDDGRGHIAVNEQGTDAEDYSVIIAPVGEPFRSNIAEGRCGYP